MAWNSKTDGCRGKWTEFFDWGALVTHMVYLLPYSVQAGVSFDALNLSQNGLILENGWL